MINKYGVNACKSYYSANMLQTSFSLIAAFGDGAACGDECDCDKAHLDMMKAYKPKVRSLLTSQNVSKIVAFGDKYMASMKGYLFDDNYAKAQSYNSDRYFKQIKHAYQQIASDVKNETEIDNMIASDIAYGIYENTNNSDLAISMMNSIKASLNGKKMNSSNLEYAINIMNDYAFHSFNAAQFLPLLNIKKAPKMMTGGDVEEELELKLEGGKCTCGKCPECLKKKADDNEEPMTIDDMEKLDELI